LSVVRRRSSGELIGKEYQRRIGRPRQTKPRAGALGPRWIQ
jgi:hypothetical protein